VDVLWPSPQHALDGEIQAAIRRLDLRSQFRAEGRTRWSEAEADGTVRYVTPVGGDGNRSASASYEACPAEVRAALERWEVTGMLSRVQAEAMLRACAHTVDDAAHAPDRRTSQSVDAALARAPRELAGASRVDGFLRELSGLHLDIPLRQLRAAAVVASEVEAGSDGDKHELAFVRAVLGADLTGRQRCRLGASVLRILALSADESDRTKLLNVASTLEEPDA
jgi:hypothetical protein